MQSGCILCVKGLWCLQSKINSPEKHKETMLGYLSGWNAPHIKHLIAETPSESILLSHIYERHACCSTDNHASVRLRVCNGWWLHRVPQALCPCV